MSLLRRTTLARALAFAALLAPCVARAQTTAPASTLPPEQSVAVNPLAIPFGVFSAEYEAALPTPGFTLGVGGTYYAHHGERDSWIEAKGMYYPSETPFRGFAIGLTAGLQSARRRSSSACDVNGCADAFRTQTSPTIGVLASYDWLLGRAQRFRVGLGAGAKRILKDVKSDDPLEQVWPDGRFVIGFVF